MLDIAGARPVPGHPSPAPAVSGDAALAGDHTMIQLIHDLVRRHLAARSAIATPDPGSKTARG
jgi:hypothetical protein